MKSFLYLILLLMPLVMSCSKETERDELKIDLSVPPKGAVDKNGEMYSFALGRSMNYSIYLPPGYDTTSIDYPVLYLLHGMWGNYLDWVNNGMENIVYQAIYNETSKSMIVVMPDGLDAFYCNNYNDGPMLYEDFFIDEFMPHIESSYRIKGDRQNRAIAGLSMGGYGTTFHAFKRPGMFSSAYSMSGALDIGTSAPDLKKLLEDLTSEEKSGLPKYAMECGTEDYVVYQSNVDFDAFLDEKGIAHEYVARPGAHDWPFWKACLPNALLLASEQFE
jgi:enterochelin esterase-like enzyme